MCLALVTCSFWDDFGFNPTANCYWEVLKSQVPKTGWVRADPLTRSLASNLVWKLDIVCIWWTGIFYHKKRFSFGSQFCSSRPQKWPSNSSRLFEQRMCLLSEANDVEELRGRLVLLWDYPMGRAGCYSKEELFAIICLQKGYQLGMISRDEGEKGLWELWEAARDLAWPAA